MIRHGNLRQFTFEVNSIFLAAKTISNYVKWNSLFTLPGHSVSTNLKSLGISRSNYPMSLKLLPLWAPKSYRAFRSPNGGRSRFRSAEKNNLSEESCDLCQISVFWPSSGKAVSSVGDQSEFDFRSVKTIRTVIELIDKQSKAANPKMTSAMGQYPMHPGHYPFHKHTVRLQDFTTAFRTTKI